MIRRDLLIVMAALLPGAALAQVAADPAVLQQIQAYLNSIHSLKARFLQIAPDGSQSGGTVWLERPGRMRFQYDAPSPFLLVAGAGLLVFHDSQLQQTTNIPLGSTPLGILLAADISLSGDITVTGFSHPPGQYQLSVVRTASPGDGTLTMVFSDDPLSLRGWTVVDAQRRETRVSLYDVQLGGQFDASLFHFIDPRFFGTGPNQGGGNP
jgi:outer membrane lipoprotein-sorting protein